MLLNKRQIAFGFGVTEPIMQWKNTPSMAKKLLPHVGIEPQSFLSLDVYSTSDKSANSAVTDRPGTNIMNILCKNIYFLCKK